jgi:hypothetical protein
VHVADARRIAGATLARRINQHFYYARSLFSKSTETGLSARRGSY